MSESIENLPNGLKLIQNKSKFCFGVDAVLLSDFVRLKHCSAVVDLCTGTGIIPINLSARFPDCEFTAIEILEDSAKMAEKSVSLNNLQEKVKIINGDIKDVKKLFRPESFNAVTANPPYFAETSGRKNLLDSLTVARHEILCTLDDVCYAASFLLKSGGSFFMIHKPVRLAEIFRSLSKYRLEPKRICFVLPCENEEPNLVLIESIKNGKPQLLFEKNIVVHPELHQ